jgi:hypothetical protein
MFDGKEGSSDLLVRVLHYSDPSDLSSAMANQVIPHSVDCHTIHIRLQQKLQKFLQTPSKKKAERGKKIRKKGGIK